MFHIETSMYSDGINFPSVSIYFEGCDKKVKCKNCHNEQLWSFNNEIDCYRNIITKVESQVKKMSSIYDTIAICFLGGEPLADKHIKNVYEVSKYFSTFPNIRTIVYSWRTFEEMKAEHKDRYMEYMNYGVLGEYDETQLSGIFPASSNQYIYDFKKNAKITQNNVI